MKEKKSHALIRAMERYAADLSNEDLEIICDDIISKNFKYAEFLLKQKNSRSVYRVNYDDQEFIVVFSEEGKAIVTFLHKKWIKQNEDGTYKVIFTGNKKRRPVKTRKKDKKRIHGTGRSRKNNRGYKFNKLKQKIEELDYE